MAEPNPIFAVRLQAEVVSLNSSYTDIVGREIIDTPNSAFAQAYAKGKDVGKDTYTGVVAYYVTLEGTGLPGDVVEYPSSVFSVQVEPRLVLDAEPS